MGKELPTWRISSEPSLAIDVTVLVCTYNRCADLREMLQTALAQQTDGTFTFEVLVVDNNSTDGTRDAVYELIARGHPNLRYLFEGRQGKSYALNAGLSAVRGQIYTIADDDFVLPPDWLMKIVAAFRAYPDASYVSGKVLPLWEGEVPAWLGREHWSCLALADYGSRELVIDDKHQLCLLACSFRVAHVQAAGGYRTGLGVSKNSIGGIEDLDILQRLWKAGRHGVYLPDIYFHHKVQRDRLTKPYHRRWHTGHGRFYATMRDVEFEGSGPRLFDVPAHLYRSGAAAAFHWLGGMLRGNSAKAFEAETRLRFFHGFYRERRRTYSERGAPGAVREGISFARALLVSKAGTGIEARRSVVSDERRVFIFLDTMPQRQGSGASLRFYSNVRAYLDLGFAVEVIQIGTAPDGSVPSSDLQPVVWTRVIEAPGSSTVAGRLLFRAGLPWSPSLAYRLPQTLLARREVRRRLRTAPDAIYHLEGEWLSSVIPSLPGSVRAIWSLHDLPSTVADASTRLACEAERREPTVAERRELRFMQRLERHVARHSPLILCIAQHDCERLQHEWGCRRVEYLPMSIPGDGSDRSPEDGWITGGKLRLLHLGRIAHLPSYRSLEFLLEQVFPRLPAAVLDRLAMNVVGRVEPENERTKRILSLASRYPNVSFLGFVDDVVPYYRTSDLQVVGSTDASGLRTRTIESLAYGLPVLSTSVGARGIADLIPGEHLLIADDAPTFADYLSRLIDDRAMLQRLSRRGREFYVKHQSGPVVAARLARSLRQYFGIGRLVGANDGDRQAILAPSESGSKKAGA